MSKIDKGDYMGYLFLFIAVFAGSAKGYCGKKTSGYANNFSDAILVNSIRMILCVIIGFLIIMTTGDISQLIPTVEIVCISALSGVFTAFFVVSWLISVKKTAYMMLDVFLMLGVLIPLIASNILFDENIKITQWIGIILIFIAVLLMCSYNNSIKVKLTLSSFMLLLLCGVSNGIADFSQKLFMKQIPNGSAFVFNFYTYVFASLVLIAFLVLKRKTATTTNPADFKKIFTYILIMAICLFANSYFKTIAAKYLSAVQLYPLNLGSALILSTIMSTVLFKEKLTKKAVLGILIAFIGLLTINII